MRYVLGIDAGTSNVKAVVFDEQGREAAIASRENKTMNLTGNLVEQDMNAVWDKVLACVREVTEKTDGSKIEAIGITGQGEGCWLIDKYGNPLQPAMLWRDGRAVDVVNEITKHHPKIGDFYHNTTGTPPLLGNQMILLKWMKDNRKAVLDQADTLFFCKDWIRYKITGIKGSELTDAFTSLVDVKTEKISDELLKMMGLEEYRHILPDPCTSDAVVGSVLDSFADETGIRRGTPVIAGALDTSATAVGMGAIHEKDVCVIIGTTCAAEVVRKKADCKFETAGVRHEKHPLGDLYFEFQATLNGTPNIDWVLNNISLTKDYAKIDQIISDTEVGCGGVIYSPYISLAGERSPFYHPYARGGFFGISQVTTREELIRAVYEGVCLSIKDCLQSADKQSTVFLAGGGAKSRVWSQMLSDVIGMKVKIPDGKEIGAKGVALMAAVSQGIFSSYEEAVDKSCAFTREFEPDPRNTRKYELLYELYKEIRMHAPELWNSRHQMNKKIKNIDEEDILK